MFTIFNSLFWYVCPPENHYDYSSGASHGYPFGTMRLPVKAILYFFNTHLFGFYLLEDLSVWNQRTEDLEGVYPSSAARGWQYCPFDKCLWLEQRFFTLMQSPQIFRGHPSRCSAKKKTFPFLCFLFSFPKLPECFSSHHLSLWV